MNEPPMDKVYKQMMLGKHDFDGACAPRGDKPVTSSGPETFSVGIFQWLPTIDGKSVKRGKVICRVIGPTTEPLRVFRTAREVCEKLDKGSPLIFKSVRV